MRGNLPGTCRELEAILIERFCVQHERFLESMIS